MAKMALNACLQNKNFDISVLKCKNKRISPEALDNSDGCIL